MKTERFDIHQHITNQIIAAMENGAGEFRLPWHRSAGNIMRPVNVASKKAYRGVNILTLCPNLNFSKRPVHRGCESPISCFMRTT
jgi:antirestriction protein ArdC